MKFIELSGKTLAEILAEDEHSGIDLHEAGVEDDTVVRINQQGDIEVRRHEGWDVIGGLLGEFEHRIKRFTHNDWA